MKALSIVMFVTCLVLFSQPSLASLSSKYSPSSYKTNNKKQSSQLRVKSSQQAASIAKGRFGGKVLRVNRQQVNGQPGYRVKLVKSNGRVISVSVNAKTGQVSN